MRTFALILMMGSLAACRTAGEAEPEVPAPQPVPLVTPASTDVVLKRVIGGLTEEFPENRKEECTVLRQDISDFPAFEKALQSLKEQPLVEGFIFRPVIPSLQYFGFLGGESFLIQAIGSEKTEYRMPQGEIGTAALDTILAVLKEKCPDQ